MSMSSVRSTTGCLMCKTKRKKCDETKPHCLRCQKSGLECPGYTYIEHLGKPNRKPRTLPSPRTVVGQYQATALQGITTVNIEETGLPSQGQSMTVYNPIAFEAPNSANGSPIVVNSSNSQPNEITNISNPWAFLSSFGGLLWDTPTDLASNQSAVDAPNPNPTPILSPPIMSVATPMISAQISLLGDLLSLGQPLDQNPPLQHLPPSTDLVLDPSRPMITSSGNERWDTITSDNEEDPEGVVTVICRQPALDRTAEGNALPFVLQSYAIWIRRMAFEPLQLTQSARDFVFSHFEDGGQSRWILSLLAHIGSRIGNVDFVEGNQTSTLFALQTAVRQRIKTVNSHPDPDKSVLVKALHSAVETLILHFFASPMSDVVTLRQEAAPIFRQLCPEPPGAPINLPSLLQHPLGCLRHYAHIDILFGISMDIPTLFRYEVVSPTNSHQSVPAIPTVSGLQLLHGISDPLILILAKMKLMRHDGLAPNVETIASLEQGIRELPSFSGSSSESFLVILRFIVQECWRQVAYVYLYMAVCGDSCDSPRVKKVVKQYMRLLDGAQPGRLPDEFLVMTLMLISPAVQRKRDRKTIRQRFLGIYALGRTFCAINSVVSVIDDYWDRADAEGRQIMWSDLAESRTRIMGI